MAGCTASVSTFSGTFDYGRPASVEEARSACREELRVSSITRSITLGTEAEARVTRERMRACLERYSF